MRRSDPAGLAGNHDRAGVGHRARARCPPSGYPRHARCRAGRSVTVMSRSPASAHDFGPSSPGTLCRKDRRPLFPGEGEASHIAGVLVECRGSGRGYGRRAQELVGRSGAMSGQHGIGTSRLWISCRPATEPPRAPVDNTLEEQKVRTCLITIQAVSMSGAHSHSHSDHPGRPMP